MTFIIAEIGSNFRSLDDCIKAIAYSKHCGANAVKFQLASEVELYGHDIGLEIDKHFIKREWLDPLRDEANTQGIELMCSAFSSQGYSYVNEYVTRHKIASCENTDPTILKTVAHFKKPTIISLGDTTEYEMDKIHGIFKECPLTFMYCEVKYPCKTHHLEFISYLKKKYGHAGFSDHSTDFSTIPITAAHHYGASIIEKHFNPLDIVGTPDAPHSLSIPEFSGMCMKINNIDQPPLLWPTIGARPFKRTVVATQDIKIGEAFTPHNIGVYRSTNRHAGPSALDYEDLIKGKVASKNYSQWSAIDGNGSTCKST